MGLSFVLTILSHTTLVTQHNKKPLIVLLFGILFLALFILANLAPVLKHIGAERPASFLYTIFGFLCHQMYTRSMHLFDYQVAVCTRDEFIYLAMGISAIVTYLKPIKPIKWWAVILFLTPAALDGGLQLASSMLKLMYSNSVSEMVTFLAGYQSVNLLRATTAGLLGVGVGYFLFPILRETVSQT